MSKRAKAKLVVLQPKDPPRPAGLLPWEDALAFAGLQEAFTNAYLPSGPAEASLIDRMVWIDWRRRRLLAAEAAIHVAHAFDRSADSSAKAKTLSRAGVTDRTVRDEVSISDILRGSDGDDEETIEVVREGVADVERTLALAEVGEPLDACLKGLDEDAREWWAEGSQETNDDGSKTYEEGVAGLKTWLTKEALPWRQRWLKANEARPAIRAQAIAESLDPSRIRQLWEMEARLDRQYEKALSMLIRLQEMRMPDDRQASPAYAKIRAEP